MPLLSRVLPAFLLVVSFTASAQKYPVDKVTIKGGAPYTNDEILSIAALKPGDILTRETIANPAQHLLDTGLFDAAEMELAGPGNHTAILELKPYTTDKLLAASFENFIWWTPEELTAAIHERVPLFHGYCADAGNMPDLVQSALEQLLAAKGIQATTTHQIAEPTTQHPHRLLAFRIDAPEIRIQSIDLSLGKTTFGTGSSAGLKQMTDRINGSRYNEGLSGVTVQDRLLAPWKNLGYYKANVVSLTRTPVAVADNGKIGVAVQAEINTGDQYRIGSLTWTPTPLYSAEEFAKSNPIKPNDAYSEKALNTAEWPILNAYRKNGYIYAHLQHDIVADDASATVAITIHAAPGEAYTLKSVTVLGLPPNAKQAFDSDWKLQPGAIYDGNYFNGFMEKHVAKPGPLRGYGATTELQPDDVSHTVELTITYLPPGVSR